MGIRPWTPLLLKESDSLLLAPLDVTDQKMQYYGGSVVKVYTDREHFGMIRTLDLGAHYYSKRVILSYWHH